MYRAIVILKEGRGTAYVPELNKTVEVDETSNVEKVVRETFDEVTDDDQVEVIDGRESMTVYSDPFIVLDLVEVTKKDGSTYLHRRLSSRGGSGSIIIPTMLVRGVRHVGFVVQDRPAIGLKDAYEFPRGSTTDDTATEANRELYEETGIKVDDKRLERVGTFYADSGILSTPVTVFVAHVTPEEAKAAEDHVEEESDARTEWFMYGDLLAKIFRNDIVDGHTLSAFTLAQLKGMFHDRL